MSEKTILFGQHCGYCAQKSWIIFRSPLKYLFIIALLFGLVKMLPNFTSITLTTQAASSSAESK